MLYQFDIFGNLQTKSPAQLAATEGATDAVIVFDRGTASNGKPYWAYIAVKPSCYGDYMRAAKAGKTIVFADYGSILQYGFDMEVPAYVKKKMQQQYGFDENYRERLVDEINQERKKFLEERDGKINNIIVDMVKNKDTLQ